MQVPLLGTKFPQLIAANCWLLSKALLAAVENSLKMCVFHADDSGEGIYLLTVLFTILLPL